MGVDQYQEFIKQYPESKTFIKPMISGEEFLNGKNRWCLWLKDVPANNYSKIKGIMDRIEKVKKHRLNSTRKTTNELAQYPYLFGEIRQKDKGFLVIPRTTSENREYIPMDFYSSKYIAHDTCQFLEEASLFDFGILTSAMHMDWMRVVAGRLKGDYRYSNRIVYNNFPWPDVSDEQKEAIAQKAQAVLDARENYPDSTLAELYNPTLMPVDLRKAHNALDKAVDKAYRKKPFESELERIQFLFERYQKLTEPLTAEMNKKPKRSRKKKS